jgi:hypothetical protein
MWQPVYAYTRESSLNLGSTTLKHDLPQHIAPPPVLSPNIILPPPSSVLSPNIILPPPSVLLPNIILPPPSSVLSPNIILPPPSSVLSPNIILPPPSFCFFISARNKIGGRLKIISF